jgi:hypothetical protein
MSIYSPDGLRDVFFGTARKHATDRGYEFRNEGSIRQFAMHGADTIFQRVAANGVTPDHPRILRLITDAEYHSKQFIDVMIQSHRGRAGAQGGVLEDVDFQFSSSWFSPMWPFCT